MTYNNFIENYINAVWWSIGSNKCDLDELYESLNIIWFSKTSQNHEALVMSTNRHFSDKYWKVTYNDDKDEYHVDEYHKQSNTVIQGEDIETM